MIEIQIKHRSDAKTALFVYASTAVPQAGDDVALTIDDEGFLAATVLDVLHVPLRVPKTKKINDVDQVITAAAIVLIDVADLAVAAFVAKLTGKPA